MRTGGGGGGGGGEEEEKGRWGGVCENVAPEIGKHLLFDLTQNSRDRALLDLENCYIRYKLAEDNQT